MLAQRWIRRALLLASPLAMMASLVAVAPATADASTTPTSPSGGDPAPTLRLVYQSNDPSGPGRAHPDNTDTGACPNTTVGSDCTVYWIQSRGTSETIFEYYDVESGSLKTLPPYYAECGAATCEYGLTGGGPGTIPDGWVVEGSPNQTVSVIEVTEP